MTGWIKQIPVAETSEAKLYFIARSSGGSFDFWSRWLNGKEGFSVKPGIALRYAGGPTLVKAFAKNAAFKLVAIEVPADADRRWKKRKRRFDRSKWNT